MIRTRAFLVSAMVAGLGLGAAIEHTNPALGQMILAKIVETAKAPIALFAARSPGERGAGALLSTKPGRGGPHERVLSAVRDREPLSGEPAGADGSPLGIIPGSQDTGGIPKELGTGSGGAAPPFSQYQGFNSFPLVPFPIGFTSAPGQSQGGVQAPFTGAPVIAAPDQLREVAATTLPLFTLGDSVSELLPEITPSVLTIPPGAPPSNSGITPVIPVPEPSSWGMMFLGLLGIRFATVRRRTSKRSDLSGLA